MSAPPFTFERHGRSPRAALALGVSYALLLAAYLLVDAAWWLMAGLALFTLPALCDFWRNPAAGLALTDIELAWHTGQRNARLELREIDHMRFDTRWDLSVRVAAVLTGGKRIRLPYEALPPHRLLETALQARGLRVERHHFTVF